MVVVVVAAVVVMWPTGVVARQRQQQQRPSCDVVGGVCEQVVIRGAWTVKTSEVARHVQLGDELVESIRGVGKPCHWPQGRIKW